MNDFFKPSEFDSKYFEEVSTNFNLGKHYDIVQKDWTPYKKEVSSTLVEKARYSCPTLNEFNRVIWNLFVAFARKDIATYYLGMTNFNNPYEPPVIIYDGLVFGLTGKEFREAIENPSVERFLSVILHFGYEHISLEVID